MGASFEDLLDFAADAKRIAGYQLRRLQSGLMPTDWKPMPSVGAGVNEIRIHTGLEHRVIYVAKFGEAIYVLRTPSRKRASRHGTPIWLWRGSDSGRS